MRHIFCSITLRKLSAGSSLKMTFVRIAVVMFLFSVTD